MERSPWLAGLYSLLLPGLGQLYKGERANGIGFLCVSLGLWFWFAMATVGPTHARSWFSQVLLGITYLFVLLPAVSDAARRPSATPIATTHPVWYVVLLVLMTGAMALPMLWQSGRLSRGAKLAWSVIAVLNTLLAVLALSVLGSAIDRMLGDYNAVFNALQ